MKVYSDRWKENNVPLDKKLFFGQKIDWHLAAVAEVSKKDVDVLLGGIPFNVSGEDDKNDGFFDEIRKSGVATIYSFYNFDEGRVEVVAFVGSVGYGCSHKFIEEHYELAFVLDNGEHSTAVYILDLLSNGVWFELADEHVKRLRGLA